MKQSTEKQQTTDTLEAAPRMATDEPVLAQLKDMEPGETIVFPVEKAKNSYLRSACSKYGWEWGMEFSVRIDRESRTSVVTRIS